MPGAAGGTLRRPSPLQPPLALAERLIMLRHGPARGQARSRPTRCRHLRGPGFTLVELIVVMVMMAVVAAVAVPSMNNMTTQRRALGARQVLRDLTYARDRSMATGTTHWVSFNLSGHSYSLLMENPASPGFAGATTISDPARGPGQAFVQRLNTGELSGCTLSAASFDSQTAVSFDHLGRPASTAGALAADGTVSLSGSWTVTVRRTSGLITHAGGS